MTLKELTFATKIWFIILTLVWISCGFSLLLFHITLLPTYWIKATIFFSSIHCLIYIVLGVHTNDFGESEKDYRKRCKNAGLEINNVRYW